MILVTGGTGLIGSHLLYSLVKEGTQVRALRRKTSNVDEVKKVFSYYCEKADELFSKIEWVEGDLLDIVSLYEAMDKITHVYHCGAIVSMNSNEGKKMIENNVTGTANIVNVAIEKKIQKFCHVSSVAALGIETEKEITEETFWNDKANFSSYAISKYLSENEVWRASQEGLNVVIVNPSIVIGPGNWWRSSGSIFKMAYRGIRWYSSGSMAYIDVRDVVKSMTMLMKSEIKNERFIVSSENMSYKKFMELVNSSIGKPIPNKKAEKFILELAWRADKLKSMLTGSTHLLTKEIARYASMNLAYSNTKIKKALGIDFIPIAQSVEDTAKKFLADIRSGS
jgi:nucleoside-diphosphate-sugar epimerase